MKYLTGTRGDRIARKYLLVAAKVAQKSTCLRAKCGTVIVKNGKIIGKGFNSPPNNLESQRRCLRKSELHPTFKSDKTCCVHAEQRAIMNALKKNQNLLLDSRLYFMRLTGKDKIEFSDKPYCTICSKMTLDVGISETVLWHKEGIRVYNTEEYNDLSFDYKEDDVFSFNMQ